MKKRIRNIIATFLCSFFIASCAPQNQCIHEYVLHDKKSATLDEDGNIKYYTCSKCGKYFDSHKDECLKEDIKLRLKIFDYTNSKNPVYVMAGDLTIHYNETSYNSLVEECNAILENIKNGKTSAIKISSVLQDVVDFINVTYDDILKSEIVAEANNRQEDYLFANKVYASFYEMYDFYYAIVLTMGKSVYKYDFFPGYSDEQIEAEMKQYESANDEKANELQLKMDEILTEYQIGSKDPFTSVLEFTQAANDYAEHYGEEDYLHFAYKYNFGREYSIADTKKLEPFIKDYIVPLYFNVSEKRNYLLDKAYKGYQLYLDGVNQVIDFDSYFFGYNFEELRSYAKFIGGQFNNNFKTFFESENYYFSNIQNDNITGYINSFSDGTPYMFLGKQYQNISTFIHEFGHYNAAFTYPHGYMDLAELQSQGDEALFNAYLCSKNYFNEVGTQYLICDSLSGLLSTIIIGYIINEIEQYTYGTGTFTKTELLNKLAEICSDIGIGYAFSESYLYAVLMGYNGYYISYAVSAIGSLELFAEALNDINKGKKSYISIYSKDKAGENFSMSLYNAGLYSVFQEDAYKLINTIDID